MSFSAFLHLIEIPFHRGSSDAEKILRAHPTVRTLDNSLLPLFPFLVSLALIIFLASEPIATSNLFLPRVF